MDTPDKLKYVRALMKEMQEAYEELKPLSVPADAKLQKKIDEWASKISGVASGYAAEFRTYHKHYMTKKRDVVLGHADITVGKESDGFQKSIQFKSTNQKIPYAVTQMLKVALNQLTGERGEMPRKHDRRIVDMTISDAANPWPYPWPIHKVPTFDDYLDKVKSELKSLLGTWGYVKHNSMYQAKQRGTKKLVWKTRDGTGIDDNTRSWMKDLSSLPSKIRIRTAGRVDGNRSTRPVYELNSNTWIPHAITFKFRYPEGYQVIYEGNQVALELVVCHAMRSGSDIVVLLAKVVYDGGQTDTYYHDV